MAENRGIRNNNPFNIKRGSSRWLGKVPHRDSTDNVFEQFIDLDYGLRAGIILLRNYINQGYNTYRKIMFRFAPPSENDTFDYLVYVSGGSYLWDSVFHFKDVQFFNLVKQICWYESKYILTVDKYDTILQKFNL